MNHFADCNSKLRYDGFSDYEVSEEQFLRELKDSIDSGLIPDQERGIFIKEGFGALVGFCPDNCYSMEDVLSYSSADWHRQTVGKPSIGERAREVINGELTDNNYFGYKKMVQEGYDLVLGPGVKVYGQQWGKAIYCKNYQQILNGEVEDEMSVVVQGDILNNLSDSQKEALGKDYVVLRPTENIDGEVEGLVALNVSETNLPEDYAIRVKLESLPEDLVSELQGAIITYPKNDKGFYEDIFGLYKKTGGTKK